MTAPVDGVPFEGGKAENYPLLLGSGMFIDGFEEQVAGIRPEEEREIHVTFPQQYTPELAGKAAVFRVKAHRIVRRSAPEINDAFARTQGFADAASLRQAIMAAALQRKEAQARDAFADALVRQVLDGMEDKVLVYDGKNYYTINNGTYRLNTGTYYFIVMASSMNYSDDKYYGIKFQKYKLADDENAKYMWYTPDKAAIFQFDGSRTNFYVNGNPIDFTYERTVKSNGNIYFNLYKTKDQNVVLFQSEAMQVMQEVPTFINVSAPFSGWNSYKNALVVGLFNTNWRVNSFSSNYDGLTSNCATVIIDSDTGKVVDVMTPNPLYDNGVVLHWTRVSGVQANYNYDPVD